MQIKKLSLLSERFQRNAYDEVYFWKSYRLLLAILTQINSIVIVISREFSKSLETKIKNVSSFRNVTDRVISGKITGRCSIFFFKKERILLLSFQKQPLDLFYEKGVLRNFAQFTGKDLCQSIFLNKMAGLRLQID